MRGHELLSMVDDLRKREKEEGPDRMVASGAEIRPCDHCDREKPAYHLTPVKLSTGTEYWCVTCRIGAWRTAILVECNHCDRTLPAHRVKQVRIGDRLELWCDRCRSEVEGRAPCTAGCDRGQFDLMGPCPCHNSQRCPSAVPYTLKCEHCDGSGYEPKERTA